MNIKHPTIVIINGANWVGSKLVELMLEQNGNVIVVDDFSENNMPFIRQFSKDKHFVFIEKDKLDTLRENFNHIKYFIHLKHDFGVSDDRISSKYFLSETKFVDEVLSIALEKSSTYILTSSIHLHKDFLLKRNHIRENEKNAYNESDLQDYIEKTVSEYEKKAGLNARIVRLGNIYGPEMDLNKDPLFKEILSDAFYKDEIRVYGDGLEFMYYVFITDAIQGILKALFVEKTKGKIYAITNPEEVSVLTIVNKVLSLQPKARNIKFVKDKNFYDPLYDKAYIPDENLSEIGWQPKVSFDRGISLVFDYFKKDLSLQADPDTPIEFNSPPPAQLKEAIRFDFDETINLANTVLEGHNGEKDQFREFYNKLHDENSPIYNLKNKKGSTTESVLRQENITKRVVKYVFWFVTIGLIYLFIIVPVFRFGVFFWHVKNISNSLYTQTQSATATSITTDLTSEINRNLAAVSWAIRLASQEELQTELTNLAKGLDNCAVALKLINENQLTKYIDSGQQVSDADLVKIKDLLIILSSTKSELSNGLQLNLPFGASANVRNLRDWSDNMEKKFSAVLSS